MRSLSFVVLALCFACGKAPEKPVVTTNATIGGPASSEDATKSLTIDENQAREIMETAEVAVDTQVATASAPAAEAQPAKDTTVPAAKPSAPVDFMAATESGIAASLAAMSNSRGAALPEAKVQALTNSIMGVVQAAKKKNPFAIAGAWNSFVKTTRDMNKEAAAANPAISVQGILDLAKDLLDVLPDLIAAVINGDIAGIIAAAIDLVTAVIDFIN